MTSRARSFVARARPKPPVPPVISATEPGAGAVMTGITPAGPVGFPFGPRGGGTCAAPRAGLSAHGRTTPLTCRVASRRHRHEESPRTSDMTTTIRPPAGRQQDVAADPAASTAVQGTTAAQRWARYLAGGDPAQPRLGVPLGVPRQGLRPRPRDRREPDRPVPSTTSARRRGSTGLPDRAASSATRSPGPLADFYTGLAGNAIVDWVFMLGLLGIGVALILGIGMRIAAVSGAAMLIMMWSAVLPPANNLVHGRPHRLRAGAGPAGPHRAGPDVRLRREPGSASRSCGGT